MREGSGGCDGKPADRSAGSAKAEGPECVFRCPVREKGSLGSDLPRSFSEYSGLFEQHWPNRAVLFVERQLCSASVREHLCGASNEATRTVLVEAQSNAKASALFEAPRVAARGGSRGVILLGTRRDCRGVEECARPGRRACPRRWRRYREGRSHNRHRAAAGGGWRPTNSGTIEVRRHLVTDDAFSRSLRRSWPRPE